MKSSDCWKDFFVSLSLYNPLTLGCGGAGKLSGNSGASLISAAGGKTSRTSSQKGMYQSSPLGSLSSWSPVAGLILICAASVGSRWISAARAFRISILHSASFSLNYSLLLNPFVFFSCAIGFRAPANVRAITVFPQSTPIFVYCWKVRMMPWRILVSVILRQ